MVEPLDLHAFGDGQRLLAGGVVHLQQDVTDRGSGEELQSSGDGREGALVTDQEVPVGQWVRGVPTAGAEDDHFVADLGVAGPGPARPASPWTTKSMVSSSAAWSHRRTV